jgi:LEA14-like dessication related protein
MDLRSMLFGSTRRLAVVVVVLLVLAVAAAVGLGVLGSPSVTNVENRFGGVTETTTVIESNLTVSNPNPIGASLGGLTVDYAVEMNGVRMAEGTREGVSVSTGTSTLHLTTDMANERIPAWWVSHVRTGERTTLTVDADVHSSTASASFDAPKLTRTVETDLLSEFNSTEPRPVNTNSGVVSDPVLYVNETRASWGEVTNETTELDLAFVVYNPKPYPVGMTEVGYDIGMNDVTVGEGATGSGVVVPPGEARAVETTTRIRNENLDEWWVTHIERNQVSELEIDFFARLDLRATTVRVPLSGLTYTETVETDIFGTKPGTNTTAGDDGSSTATGADTGSTTESELTGTETSTRTSSPISAPTSTATPTPTSTPTPEGGGLLGGGDGTETRTATPTATATETPTVTPDDGGLLGSSHANGR